MCCGLCFASAFAACVVQQCNISFRVAKRPKTPEPSTLLFCAMTFLSSGILLRADLMMLMVPLFEALGHDLKSFQACAPCKLQLVQDALMTAARCTGSVSTQDVLQAVAIALQCVTKMVEGIDVATGDFTQWIEVSWRQFAEDLPLPCASMSEHEVFLHVAGSSPQNLMGCLRKSREASVFMATIAECFVQAQAPEPVPIQQAFRQAREVLEEKNAQWKKIVADVLSRDREKAAVPDNDVGSGQEARVVVQTLTFLNVPIMCVGVGICASSSCSIGGCGGGHHEGHGHLC